MYYIHHKMYISTWEVNQYIISSILRHGFNVALPVPPPFLFGGTVTTTCRSYVSKLIYVQANVITVTAKGGGGVDQVHFLTITNGWRSEIKTSVVVA